MTTPLLRLGGLALLAWTAAACVTFDPSRTVRQDPLILEDRGEVVFAQYLIPVAERRMDYRVRSGTFRADEIWGPGGVAERVACGGDEAGNALSQGPVELSVEVRISPRTYGSRVRVESSGRTLGGDQGDEVRRCKLKETFARELLTAIAGASGPGVVGLPSPTDPGGVPRPGLPGGGGPNERRN